MFNPSRDQARKFFFEAWGRYRRGEGLAGLDELAVGILLEHPEYHPVLDRPERYLEQEYFPEAGESNPFLHLAMHLAIEEQLSIDQPPGIRRLFQALAQKTGSRHDAVHGTMECLAEMLWRAQRDGVPPDPEIYLQCLELRSRK